jgi:hypothetical protein
MGIFDKITDSGFDDVYVAKDENEKIELLLRLQYLCDKVDAVQVPEITM